MRGKGLRGGPSRTSLGINKSGVEQFEWSLITLVSVAWRPFTKSRTILSVFERSVEIRSNGEKSQKKEPTLCLNQNRKGWATPEHSLIHFLMIPIRVPHPPSLLGARSRRPHPISLNQRGCPDFPRNRISFLVWEAERLRLDRPDSR